MKRDELEKRIAEQQKKREKRLEEQKMLFDTLDEDQKQHVLNQLKQAEKDLSKENKALKYDAMMVYQKKDMTLIGSYDEVYLQIAKETGRQEIDMAAELEKRGYIIF